MRTSTGMTLKDAAELLDISVSGLSKIETAQQRVRVRELPAFFQVYGITDEAKQGELLRLARDAAKTNWWQEYAGVIRDPLADYLSLEEDAAAIGVFNGLLVPGLLQTEAYARAVVEASREWQAADEIERFVGLRMQRQSVVRRDNPVRLWAVVTEGALRQIVGGQEVMVDQLQHLIESCTQAPHVTLQILPYTVGAHAGMDGGFAILSFATGPAVVCVENLTSTIYLEQEVEVGRYATTFDYLKSAALSPRQSLSKIRDIIEELKR